MINRCKVLIEGKPGTGNTFTASIIASETGLPLYTVQMDKLVTKFMAETSVNSNKFLILWRTHLWCIFLMNLMQLVLIEVWIMKLEKCIEY
mgnify:CR=1 FL=1